MNQQTEVSIHPECAGDTAQIRAVTEAAFSSTPFGHHGEADLIERLRRTCPDILSLVAKHADRIVGHVLFSPVVIQNGDPLSGMGLGPVSVLPGFQRRGIGTLLIRRGIEMLSERGCSFVCVFGHPAFYPRFGFQSAQQFGIDSEFGGASDGTFQILWLKDRPGMYDRAVVHYRPEFSQQSSAGNSGEMENESWGTRIRSWFRCVALGLEAGCFCVATAYRVAPCDASAVRTQFYPNWLWIASSAPKMPPKFFC